MSLMSAAEDEDEGSVRALFQSWSFINWKFVDLMTCLGDAAAAGIDSSVTV